MPEPYTTISSKLIPLGAENIDTDQIIPARFLKTTQKSGLADALFNDWRYLPDGSPDPGFILNRPEIQGRQVLLVGDNFGAGSSREHAPWALTSWGIRAVISTSFADIFRSNSLKNGLLPIVVDPATHRRLWEMLEADPDAGVTIDLAEQGMLLPDGTTYDFEIDPFARQMLLAGTDEIGWVLQRSAAIDAWEAAHPAPVDTTPIVGGIVPGAMVSGGSPAPTAA
jgi:3-isopropylmalate/(R)-2-methylmalate dehydratase small subunit